MELYDIFISGEKVHKSITEDEMLDITQDLADEFYHCGFPHPDEIEVKYLGHEDDPQ